jgi:hypothetical protein
VSLHILLSATYHLLAGAVRVDKNDPVLRTTIAFVSVSTIDSHADALHQILISMFTAAQRRQPAPSLFAHGHNWGFLWHLSSST